MPVNNVHSCSNKTCSPIMASPFSFVSVIVLIQNISSIVTIDLDPHLKVCSVGFLNFLQGKSLKGSF